MDDLGGPGAFFRRGRIGFPGLAARDGVIRKGWVVAEANACLRMVFALRNASGSTTELASRSFAPGDDGLGEGEDYTNGTVVLVYHRFRHRARSLDVHCWLCPVDWSAKGNQVRGKSQSVASLRQSHQCHDRVGGWCPADRQVRC